MLQKVSARELNRNQENRTATGAGLLYACFKVFGLRTDRTDAPHCQTHIFNLYIMFSSYVQLPLNLGAVLPDGQSDLETSCIEVCGNGNPQGCVLGPTAEYLLSLINVSLAGPTPTL